MFCDVQDPTFRTKPPDAWWPCHLQAMSGPFKTDGGAMPSAGYLGQEQMSVSWWQVHRPQNARRPTTLLPSTNDARAGNNEYANRTPPRKCPSGSVGVRRLCPWDVHGSKDPRSSTGANRTGLSGASSHISKTAHRTCKTRFIVFMGPTSPILGWGYGGGPIFWKTYPAPGPLQPPLQVIAVPRAARMLGDLTKVACKLQFGNV